MSYAAKQDLIDRFGLMELTQLTDRTNRPPSVVDDVVVERAIADATAMVDGYVAKRYAVPLATVPDILVKTAADIARYYLHGKAADEKSTVAIAYNQALAWLKDVSKGLIALDGADQLTPAGGGSVKANPSTRVMRRDTLRGL